MAPETDSTSTPDRQQVPFDTGCLGCVSIVMIVATAIFGGAVFHSGLFADLADARSPRNWLGALAPFRVGGVNIAVLLLTAFLAWETIKLIRRLTNRKAVWIEAETVRFHPTLRQAAIPLSAISSASHTADTVQSVLVVHLASGRRIKVATVDHDAAAAFVDEINRRLTERRLS